MKSHNIMEKKVRLAGEIVFQTSFHIGSGREGEMSTDMGVLREPGSGRPVLPGSSLKGIFRSTAEKLAVHLGMTACFLDMSLSNIQCVTDEEFRRGHYDGFKKLVTEKDKLKWLDNKICDVCRLFGSPLHGSRIFFSDGLLKYWSGATEIRDGVCLDRDSETARPNMKFDYEVVPSMSSFEVQIDVENPDDQELALIGAVLAEWQQSFKIGGKTSRGLGLAVFKSVQVDAVDFSDMEQLSSYLLHKKMTSEPDLLQQALKTVLQNKGGQAHA